MSAIQSLILAFILFVLNCSCSNSSTALMLSKESLVFSAIQGEMSRVDTLVLSSKHLDLNSLNLKIEPASQFALLTPVHAASAMEEARFIVVQFRPEMGFVGVAEAELIISDAQEVLGSVELRGLGTKGLEGKNEPPLSMVLEVLGFSTDVGWKALANHTKPTLQGEEIKQTLFRKVDDGKVEMIPLARYSPAFELPFGYYIPNDSLPELKEVGILEASKLYPEHQTLYPSLKSGNMAFEPGTDAFGFYTISPSHVAYSEDVFNKKLHPKNAAHACRVYPLKRLNGELLVNQYIVCFEEAFNGDYQDYVFLVKNIAPIFTFE